MVHFTLKPIEPILMDLHGIFCHCDKPSRVHRTHPMKMRMEFLARAEHNGFLNQEIFSSQLLYIRFDNFL